MQVILKEDVEHVGQLGDVVNVKLGFARNYLLPRGLAVAASDRQVAKMQHELRVIQKRLERLQADAVSVKDRLDKVSIEIAKAAGENEKLFGSVTAMEIDALLREKGFEVDRRKIVIAEPIKALGEHAVNVKLHKDVVATIKVVVVAQAD